MLSKEDVNGGTVCTCDTLIILRRAAIGIALTVIISLTSPARAADQLELWPRISLGEMLTDNLIQETNSGGGGDAITVVALGGSATLDSDKRTSDLDYVTDAELYARNSSLNEAFHNQYVGLRDNEQLTGATNLSVNDTFFSGQERFAQTLIGSSAATPLLSQALVQNNVLTNGFDLQLDHRFSDRFSSFANVHQVFFSTSSGQTSESFQQGGELAAYYKVNARLSLGPDFRFNDMRFSNEPHADSYQPSLGAKLIWSEELSIDGTAGPLIMSTSSGTSIDFGYTLSSTYTGERWLFELFSARAPSISAGTSGSSVNQYEGGSVAYLLSRRTTAFISGSFNQFSRTSNSSYGTTYGGGIIHRLTKSISMSAQFIRFQTNSQSVNGNSTDTLMLSIKYSPQPWVFSF